MLLVVDQMQIHRIVGTDGIVGSNCICNFTMSFDSFIMHGEFADSLIRGIELLMIGTSFGTTIFLLLKAIAV